MLLPRILTALVLLAVLLPALLAASATPLIALSLLFIAAGAWEWARLNGLGMSAALATGVFCAALCAVLWWLGVPAWSLSGLWLVVGLVWLGGGALLLRRGVAGWPQWPLGLRWTLGVAVLCLAWLALAQARRLGVEFLLSVLVLVWVADVFAYISGRLLGGRFTRGRKLAPTISPGKSWEGVVGGMLAVLLLAFGWPVIARANGSITNLYAMLLLSGGLLWLIFGVFFLAAMSVVGDLAESLVKRSAGMKDSSALLPGHGGVLDRIDALLPVLPLAMMLVTVLPWLREVMGA